LVKAEEAFSQAFNLKKFQLPSSSLDFFCDRWSTAAKKRRNLIAKGSDKISHQLDIVKFLKSQIVFDSLLKI
jgi:hypothetical protein